MDTMKCIKCKEPVEKIDKDGEEFYKCKNGHIESRTLEHDDKIVSKEVEEGTVHFSVGAIVKKGEKILLIDRRKYPFAHTIPAGHLEHENAEIAVQREVEEETGLKIDTFKLIKHVPYFYDPCRRGVDYHEWDLFEADYDGSDDFKMDDEGKSIKFYSPEEIKSLKLTLATEKFLKELGII